MLEKATIVNAERPPSPTHIQKRLNRQRCQSCDDEGAQEENAGDHNLQCKQYRVCHTCHHGDVPVSGLLLRAKL